MFWAHRVGYYGSFAMPLICGDGRSDVFPPSDMEEDFQAHAAGDSPLRITVEENGPGVFTAHIVAEETITGARLCMVATHDDYVAGYGGSNIHLPYHVVEMMTAGTGDDFELAAGESMDVQRSFTIQPEWDYENMGVACWVQAPGGTNPSPSPDIADMNHVLQSAFVGAGGTTGLTESAGSASVRLAAPHPNPFTGSSSLSFVLPARGAVTLAVYDIAGRMVAELVGEPMGAGEHHASWDGRDSDGRECASGIYFARLVYDGADTTGQKLVKLR